VPDDSTPPPPPENDGEPTLYRPHAELRAVAAYALGVIGGDQAIERLEQMLHDSYPNARYNAATGLARIGNAKCVGVLKEMLDPTNPLAYKDEINPNDQAHKRVTVLLNGMSATLHLAAANPSADLTSLKTAIENLASAPLEQLTIDRGKVKNGATETLARWRTLESKASQ
jgi:HEAT repeat protein